MSKTRYVWVVATYTSLVAFTVLSSQVVEMELKNDVRWADAMAVSTQMGGIPSEFAIKNIRSTVFQVWS